MDYVTQHMEQIKLSAGWNEAMETVLRGGTRHAKDMFMRLMRWRGSG